MASAADRKVRVGHHSMSGTGAGGDKPATKSKGTHKMVSIGI